LKESGLQRNKDIWVKRKAISLDDMCHYQTSTNNVKTYYLLYIHDESVHGMKIG